MQLKSFQVKNLKSFADSGPLALAPLTVLVGPNNAGKSTLLKALSMMQQPDDITERDFRDPMQPIGLEAQFRDLPLSHFTGQRAQVLASADLSMTRQPNGSSDVQLHEPLTGNNFVGLQLISNQEPNNLIYPYTSKRKVAAFAENVDSGAQSLVPGNLSNIVAKLDRVSNVNHPAYPLYAKMCKATLGFVVTTFASPSGKMAGIYVDANRTIALDAMGEGVSSLVGLIAELCSANGRLFLVEELENDVHPQALKRLLDIVIERSEANQFVISTHSNIVVRQLGATSAARLFDVQMDLVERIPTSRCAPVAAEVGPRARLLEQLGYELTDFDLWDGWLILEESSAERIIRDHLIRWFTPRLSSTRTLAVGGVSRLGSTFNDFHRLFLFTHLEERYRGRAWVIADGDPAGASAIEDLRNRYSKTWTSQHFRTWRQSDFELYYPSTFDEDVAQALSVSDKQRRRDAKKVVLQDVLAWIVADDERARHAFQSSAAEVIGVLEEIDAALHGNS